MTQVPNNLLEVGRIGKPHGVRGDLFVSFTTDVESRFSVGASFTVKEGGSVRELVIESLRPQQERWVVHFAGVDDRNMAEKLVNKFLLAEPVDDNSALWVHELIGSRVVDEQGNSWGECIGVLQNPAHDILELADGVLVPMPFVVSCQDGITVINPPEGLREALSSEKDAEK